MMGIYFLIYNRFKSSNGRSSILLVASLMLFISSAYAYNPNDHLGQSDRKKAEIIQQIIVKGKVTDDTGKGIPGVTVRLKNTSTLAVSDKNGAYAIAVPNNQGVLVFTFIGFETQEIQVNSRTIINIMLKARNGDLNEVVVIGYGEVKRQDLTGSVGSVKMVDLQKAPVRSFEEALAGRVAGVQVSSGDGQPGSASNIVIRGNNSLTQDNSPLYVVDGFPLESPDNNVINPAEIESIDVLKDASATAIYGARGANGVIVITTKKGKAGATTLTYDGFYGINSTIKKVDLLSPYEFVKLQKEAFPGPANDTYFKDGTTLEDYRNVPSVDWQDQLLQTAPFQNHNLAIRGGSSSETNYSVSGSIVNQEGSIIKSGFKRYQGRIVLNQKITNKLKSGVNVNYTRTKAYGTLIAQYGGVDRTFGLMANVWGYRPIGGGGGSEDIEDYNEDLINSDLDPSIDPTSNYFYNPISTVKNEINDRFSSNVIANGFLQYQISKYLSLKISGGIDNSNNTTNTFYNSHTRNGDPRTLQGANGPNGRIGNYQADNFLNENTLTYNRQINKLHNLNVLLGYTFQGQNVSAFSYSASQVPNENLGISGLDEGLINSATSSKTSNRLQSFLGRVNYNYKSIYYLTASYRADGSSKFAPENHWSYFPSVGASWRISKESFLKDVTAIHDAKLRLGYGVTGNNRVPDFPYLSTLTLPISADYPFDNVYYNGAALSILGNHDLKWETTAQLDAGLDVELLKGNITLSLDYYNKKTSNLLLYAQLPGSTGFVNAFENIGKVQNRGLEITLSTTNISTHDFSWSSSFNISFNKSKVLELVDGQESLLSPVAWATNTYGQAPAYIAKIGQPVSQMYGYIFDGVYQYSDFNVTTNGAYVLKPEITSNGNARNTIQPGYIKYKDINGDGVVNTQDQTVIGHPYPVHFGGLSNNFRYKNFDLNIFFQWSYGNDIINANRYNFEGMPTAFNKNQFASYANRWTPENTNTDIPAVNGQGPNVYSSRVIEDGSYLRLKTAQLGYNFKDKFLKKIKVKGLRLYVSGQNLITWTNYSGQDPEVSSYNSALTPGFDYSAYPRARTFTFGANFSL